MAESVISQIPTSFYVTVGGLILINLGTFGSLFYGIGRLVWFISKLESRVESLEKDINAAHGAIREIRASLLENKQKENA